ncbi:response regulator [Acaryochloris sp. CCMEE 5410]|uniref:response regulator n=1 Tax=Acaryochloris sp. CCMEE 5410 TaxID=310037 RepID=UPI0002484EC9|nr:response regulator [Acaryochloris sp. CCMEE 5410]KAI9132287.1 response regulator [Acaryochloris sp. CCMEE 5410]
MADTLLLLNHNACNQILLTQFLEGHGYHTVGATSYEGLEDALASPHFLRLALIDISGFDPQIWTHCRRLRQRQIPFIILSARRSTGLENESFAHGAHGVLIKPLVQEVLLNLLHSFLEEP